MTDDIYIQALRNQIQRQRGTILVMIFIILGLIAGLIVVRDSHADLKLAGRIDPDPARVSMLRMVGAGEAFVHVWDTKGSRDWFSFACPEDTIRWKRGESVALTMKDGSEVRSIEALAPTSEARIIPLGTRSLVLTDQVERRRFRGGPVAAVIFAAFRLGLDPDSVISVRRSP